MSKIKVYIASPYTIGNTEENLKKSFLAYSDLVGFGFLPFSPLTSHYINMWFPRNWCDWMDIDLEWINVCDVLLRLPGESKGADLEVEFAKQKGKPVFFSMEELLTWRRKNDA